MADKNGNKTGGRKKGVPNKTTKDIRESFQCFVEDNVDNFQEWLDRVAETNPAKAIELVNNMSEYILPKLIGQQKRIEELESEDEIIRAKNKVLEKYLKDKGLKEDFNKNVLYKMKFCVDCKKKIETHHERCLECFNINLGL